MQADSKTYYAVIFTSKQKESIKGYDTMANYMVELAKTQPGYIGMESARDSIGITISYWKSIKAIKQWKAHSEHLIAQDLGKSKWYDWYKVRICKVEHDYAFNVLA